MTKKLWLEVDLHAVEKNLTRIRAIMPEQMVMAVVKADAYGLGMVEVARFLERKVDFFGVNDMDEGIKLRDAGIRTPILLFSPFFDPEAVLEYHLTPTIDQEASLVGLDLAAEKKGVVAPFHLKIDTGIHRFGMAPGEVPQLISRIKALSFVHLEGVYSHFAVTMKENPRFAERQLSRFNEVAAFFMKEGLHVPILHMANSEMAIDFPAARFQMVRIGNALYGPVATKRKVGLTRVYQLKAKVLRILSVPSGERIGYGASYRAKRKMRLAILPYGVSNGYGWLRGRVEGDMLAKGKGLLRMLFRALFPLKPFFYQGNPLDTIGKPFMNYVLLDVTDYPDLVEGSTIFIRPSSTLTLGMGAGLMKEYIGKREEEEDAIHRERGEVQV